MILDKELLIISTRTHVVTFRPRYIRKVTTVQSCEIRDLLKCKSRLALDKVNDFKGLK